MEKLQVQIKILPGNDDIEVPRYMTESSAGLDIEAAVFNETVIKSGEVILVPTGIALSIPSGYEAQVRPRSGLALKYGITILNSPGTIDADYRGEIKIILANFGKEDFKIQRKDRIAQIVFNKIEKVNFQLVSKLDDSERGSKGFGHTGL